MKAIPLFGEGVATHYPVITRQRRLNCFFDVRVDKDKRSLIVRATPGLVATYVFPSSPIRGWRSVANVLYVVAGGTLYSLTTNGTITALGTLNAVSTTGNVVLADNGVQLLVVDGVAGYVYTIVTGSYAQAALNNAGSFGIITDVNFPNGTNSVCFLDGRLVAVKVGTRQFYCSEQYDATNWTNSSSLPTYGTKDNASDPLVAVVEMNGLLVLIGQQTTEFWQDVGSYPLPFSRVQGATRSYGIVALYSLAFINESWIFVGQGKTGGGGNSVEIFQLKGMAIQRISVSDVEDIIDDFTVWSDAVAFSYVYCGHQMYQVTFPTGNRSFLYDATMNLWSEVQTSLNLLTRHLANLGTTFNNNILVSDPNSSVVYTLTQESFTDNGIPIKRQVTSRHIHVDGNDFAVDELWLDVQTGVGLQAGQGQNPQIMLRVSKDNGRTFGAEQWAAMGAVGQYMYPRVRWTRQGRGTDFVFEWTMSDPVDFVIVGGSVKISQEEGSDG